MDPHPHPLFFGQVVNRFLGLMSPKYCCVFAGSAPQEVLSTVMRISPATAFLSLNHLSSILIPGRMDLVSMVTKPKSFRDNTRFQSYTAILISPNS